MSIPKVYPFAMMLYRAYEKAYGFEKRRLRFELTVYLKRKGTSFKTFEREFLAFRNKGGESPLD